MWRPKGGRIPVFWSMPQGDHPDTLERKAYKETPKSTLWGLNPAPSSCEVTVLTSDPPCHCLGSWWCVGLNNYHLKRLDGLIYMCTTLPSSALVQPVISDVWSKSEGKHPQRRMPGYEELAGRTCLGRPEPNVCVFAAHTTFQADKNP